MLRIHFTSDDLARVRVAAGPDVMWEIANSLHLLADRAKPAAFGGWWYATRERVRSSEPLRAQVDLLATLYPRGRYFPDFLTPPGSPSDVDTGIDTVLSTPRTRLRAEVTRLAGVRRLPSWTSGLATGEPETLARIGSALREYHRIAFSPLAGEIRGSIDAHNAASAKRLLHGGVDALLGGLGPGTAWRPPVLEVAYPCEQELVLGGRGLVLVPSYFAWAKPISLADPGLPPVLVHPIAHRPSNVAGSARRLAALLGPTRAAILETVVSGHTTTELSRRIGISPATASHHTTTLRESGLLSTTRLDNRVIHRITPLGQAVLDGS
jgi:DNA-binding transcriptional ArsR family regulator